MEVFNNIKKQFDVSHILNKDNKIRPSPDEMAIALFVIIDQTAKNKPARSSPVS